ncbi:fibrillin-1 isoform X2 [Xenopus laevis]|uniref:Uromodulin n=1 Tax=Xenopus laevis TaxID=8355 RepID=A0A8J1LVK8_XENLA|nr:fibrillin-1 isoform X2 [Xenopus laevis]
MAMQILLRSLILFLASDRALAQEQPAIDAGGLNYSAVGCNDGEDQGGIPEEKPATSSLTYLVDTTGSMFDDLQQLKLVNDWLLDSITAQFPSGVRQYTMVEFNDPTTGPVRLTHSKDEFKIFFSHLTASGGGDCPELTMNGLKLALENSPPKSFILVLTDASSKDYTSTALLNNIRSLLSTKQSQVFFLITGLCSGLNEPGFLIYRDIASLSYGHVFQIELSDLGKVFNYLEFTLSRPVNSTVRVFYQYYNGINHCDNFTVTDDFTNLLMITDGSITSIRILGPGSTDPNPKTLVSETWGSLHEIKRPAKGAWTLCIVSSNPHAVQVEGLIVTNTSCIGSCSDCHHNAICEAYTGHLKCTCKDGFIGDGVSCSDIDECAYSWLYNCAYGICENTIGSYKCVCPAGYTKGTGKETGNTCVDIDECSSPDLNKCHPIATCFNYVGTYTCQCPPGILGNGFHCDPCSRGVCGVGMECLTDGSSYSCSDPCVSHTVLDEPWRSAANMQFVDIKCDYDKVGWYRFNGSGGIRMPESCVPTWRCNSHIPMWLNGSHPIPTDGIVSRNACAHWAGVCCLWSSTVQIKACPGGYHVYKLNGTPGCSMTYCTVTNNSLTGRCSDCHPNATCKGFLDLFECTCKDGFIGDGVSCSDIDECAYSWLNNCSNGNCVNTIGSYHCVCPGGYTKGAGNTCVDIDECSRPDLNRCHPIATCTNYDGTYTCQCPPGVFGNGFHCEDGPCTGGVCGVGQDCLANGISYSCADPCVSHTVLDEPWRSAANAQFVDIKCDYDKVGWYRFIGSGGIRMSESCVPTWRCNSHIPMWLNGSHPIPADGIVSRNACAHWAGVCCLWSSTVQIKACPGGYYVYKLNGTPGCSMTYCTVTSTSCPGSCSDCHPDATCEGYPGQSVQCTCKDGFIGDGVSCSDIDECANSWLNNCTYGNCVNTIGSYDCVCPTGYTKGAGNTCVDIDECSNPDLNTCHPIATCINKDGTYTCQCPPGAFSNGFNCEFGPCTGDVCGVGQDCLTDGRSYSCADPCVSHTVLNEPWRSAANAEFVDIKCDYDKVGWYRFIGSGGIRMPESCVPTWRCNSHIPMWLNGSHPIPADGIVSLIACAHWAGVCCLWSSTVQIKACPGGYHVYKLNGTPGCSMTYCTVTNTPCPGCCSHCHPDATCEGYSGQSSQCTCKDGFTGDGVSCSDVDECAISSLNSCSYGYCVNTIGSYNCVCLDGYTKGTGNTCVDIDECSSPDLNKCHPLATCNNYDGGYTCQCRPGVFGNGFHCEDGPCSRGVCGVGMDCLTDGISHSCSDPCVSHTVLDEPWRSTANAQFVDIKCDYDKVGWYRFIGSGGVRMSESCVPTWRCNSHIPMWLNGSHPIPADGIVSRNACAHWAGVCCLWSSTVQIKACPGGYYVYKLDGTPGCSMTYCTAHSSCPGSCSDCHPNAICKANLDSLKCTCKDGFSGDGFSCSDIDECAYSWLNNCAYGYCVNTIGSYYCVCPTGYTKGAGNTCVDIDECSSPDLNKCHPIATCINYVGTYTCQCPCGVLGNGFHCEIDPCTGGVCGVGMECLTDGSSYSCSDPCVSHTVLDEPWRSSSNAQFVDIKCDYDKVGWYRFIGSGGIRMPESCVPTWRCNSHIPMWLNGSHPIPADGIVSRNACAHWAGVSCLWSSTVQIKDCPGGYHVYKLDGTPGCSMTYCTDPSSINGDCLCTDDEECRFVSGSYGCYCKESRAISAFSDLTPSVSCGLHNMKTSFRKCQLRALQIDVNYIKLENSSCFTVLNDYTTNTYSVLSPLQAGNCGMKLTTNGTHASYVNRYDFYFILPGNIIREKLTMTSTCIYPLDMRLSLITALDPIISTTDISITGTGEFKAYMAVYNNSDYKYPYQGAQINLYTKTVIYIGVFLDGPDPSQYALVLKNCYATPSSNPDDPIKYYIIQNRCPSRSDNTVNVVQNGLSSQAQFSFQMFAFVGDYNQVYLHCEIYACNNMTSTCLPTCKSRATAVTTENTFNLKIGPFINLDSPPKLPTAVDDSPPKLPTEVDDLPPSKIEIAASDLRPLSDSKFAIAASDLLHLSNSKSAGAASGTQASWTFTVLMLLSIVLFSGK